jgi:hypothetical protein
MLAEVYLVPRWLGLDACVPKPGRVGHLLQMAACSLATGGWRGWLYVATLVLPLGAIVWWLRSGLKSNDT